MGTGVSVNESKTVNCAFAVGSFANNRRKRIERKDELNSFMISMKNSNRKVIADLELETQVTDRFIIGPVTPKTTRNTSKTAVARVSRILSY